METVVVSPLNMKTSLLEMIGKEMSAAAKGKPAAIWLKLNSLVDEQLIDALYRASQAGVHVDLIVRDSCRLRPGRRSSRRRMPSWMRYSSSVWAGPGVAMRAWRCTSIWMIARSARVRQMAP